MHQIKCKLNKGITLIALIITIIILLILAGVVINALFGDSSILKASKEGSFKYRMQELNEQTGIYVVEHMIETNIENGDVLQKSKVNAGDLLQQMIGSDNNPLDKDFTHDQITNDLKDIMKNIKSNEEKYIVVYEGELCYVSQSSIPNNAEQVKWCKEIGIRVLEFKEPVGIEKTNGDYENIDGIYMATPDLSEFARLKARYLKLDDAGNLVPATSYATLYPDPDWYNYNEQKWANIYIENEGNCAYYVWIPRYAYKPQEGNVAGQERADVVFIDMENNHKYIDETTGETKTIEWEELEEDGYIIPDAFYWGDDDTTASNNTPIPGYWMSKYVLGEISNLVVQYDFSAEKAGVVISNIVTNIEGIKNTEGQAVTISAYEFSINGRVVGVEKEKPEKYTMPGLKTGMNSFTVTLLDQNGEIIGSMTKDFEISEANAPNLDGFDRANTYYVTYDNDYNEHSTIPTTQKAPDGWYDYGTKQWANVVVRENGAETYLTWIPRYAYTTSGERATVKFLNGTTNEKPDGYIIPDAFYWGDDDNVATNNTPITGYWITKYVLGESSPIDATVEVTTAGGTIITQGLKGTTIAEGQKYIYWVDGKKVDETEDATEKIVYKGLETGKTYTILIEIRSGDALVGTITKEVTVRDANAPDLSGFDNDEADGDNTMTYYVTYGADGNGEEDSTRPITQTPPANWYNYAERRWANVVVKKTNENGDIIAQTYYTWIPRYAYKQVGGTAAGQERADVIFLNETSSEIPDGYTIPDAFYWGDDDTTATNNTPLKGYWITKYVLGE